MIVLRRPGTGLAPSMLATVVGRRAKQEISAGALLDVDMFE
jgi:sialic acid synthase SpsE